MNPPPPQAIVLDIEGTTTPIAFVYGVLFPFARRHLRAYLLEPRNQDALQEPLRLLAAEWGADTARGGGVPVKPPAGITAASLDERREAALQLVATYLEWLMDQDRKSPGLKLLQGRLWDEGYRSGELKGEVFPDVAPALRRWRDAGLSLAIYSSGSGQAQRLLFGSTADGDLTPLFSRFFDTAVGAKREAESYRRIARELLTPEERILFVSDVVGELDAASSAGCQVLLCVRPGNPPQGPHAYRAIERFDEIG